MKRIDVRNKSREDIEQLLANVRRQQLYDVIYSLAALEPHYSVAEFAQRRRLTKDKVHQLIRDGALAPVHVPTDRGDYRIPLSTARAFDERTAINVPT